MDDTSFVKVKLKSLLDIVSELEERFPGRKFTLDGHLLGSIGEALAKEYYDITLYPNGQKTHDGFIGEKKVQIKITQGNSVDINDVPDFLLVLFLNKSDRNIYEVYNGPCAWLRECKKTKNGWYNRSLRRLSEYDKNIRDDDRIKPVKHIEKWSCDIKN